MYVNAQYISIEKVGGESNYYYFNLVHVFFCETFVYVVKILFK